MKAEEKKVSWRARARSFRYAFSGIAALIGGEHNARIHLCVALLVIAAGFLFSIRPWEWCAVILCIGGVFMAEGFNSAIEALADEVSPQFSPLVKRCKDIAAASVLLFVFAAVAVGLIVFLPYVFNLF